MIYACNRQSVCYSSCLNWLKVQIWSAYLERILRLNERERIKLSKKKMIVSRAPDALRLQSYVCTFKASLINREGIFNQVIAGFEARV